jgi:hypothetical protein
VLQEIKAQIFALRGPNMKILGWVTGSFKRWKMKQLRKNLSVHLVQCSFGLSRSEVDPGDANAARTWAPL